MLKASDRHADEQGVSEPAPERSALRPRAQPTGSRARGWTFVFARCVNCGNEIHRSHGRSKPWLHANLSPLCPEAPDPEQAIVGSTQCSVSRHP